MKKITINITDKDYELKLTRNGIKWLENNGFDLNEFLKKPITHFDLLWTVGFIESNPNLTVNEILELQDKYKSEGGDPKEITSFMYQEYLNFINAQADTKSIKKKAIITEA